MNIGWADLGIAIGLVLVIEGALYALFPAAMKNLMRMALTQDDEVLRNAGFGALIAGLAIAWFISS